MDNTQPQVLVGLFISSSPVQFVVFNEERAIGGGWLMATSLIVDAILELRDDWRIDDSSATNSWVGRSTLARSIDVAFIMGASDVATDNISVNHGNGLAIGDAMIFERPRVTRGFSLLDRVVEARQRATVGWPRCCLKGAAGVSAANVAVGEFHLQQLGVEILSSDAIVDGSIIDRSLVIDAIHKLDNDSRVTNDSFAISIPVPSMIIEKIHRSTMAEQELPQSIQWEAEQYIPFDISDVRLDYVVLSDAEIEWGNMEVLLVAVKRDKINEYTSVISQAGKTPVTIRSGLSATMSTHGRGLCPFFPVRVTCPPPESLYSSRFNIRLLLGSLKEKENFMTNVDELRPVSVPEPVEEPPPPYRLAGRQPDTLSFRLCPAG